MSSLKLYRRLKQQLVREDYLTVADSHPQLARSVWDRRCTVDMARLRCGVADIALVRGRRCGVDRQQRYCRWCDRESKRNGGLLWCRAVEDLFYCTVKHALRNGDRKLGILGATHTKMTPPQTHHPCSILSGLLVHIRASRLLVGIT